MSRPEGQPKIILFAGGAITLNVLAGSRDEQFRPINESVEPAVSGKLLVTRTGFRFEGSYNVYMTDSDEAEDIMALLLSPDEPTHPPGCFFQPYDDYDEFIVYGLVMEFEPIYDGPLADDYRIYRLKIISTNVLQALPWPDEDRSGYRLTHKGELTYG